MLPYIVPMIEVAASLLLLPIIARSARTVSKCIKAVVVGVRSIVLTKSQQRLQAP